MQAEQEGDTSQHALAGTWTDLAAALKLLANLAQAEPACVVVLCRMPLEGYEGSQPQLMAFLADILAWPGRLAVPASVLRMPSPSVQKVSYCGGLRLYMDMALAWLWKGLTLAASC